MPFKNFRISKNLSDLPTIPLGELKELQGDLKDLKTENYNRLKHSIEKHGFIAPFYVWIDGDGFNRLIDGHQRLRTITKEKVPLDTPMPVVYIEADTLQEAKEKLLVISSQYGLITQEGYDAFTFDLDEGELELLVNFDALKVWPTDEESDTGKGEDDNENGDGEISDAEPQISKADELNEIWQVKTADLWRIGEHRLLCGDSTKREDVARLMGEDTCELVVTDPPYGVSYAAKNAMLNANDGGNRIESEIESDHMSKEDTQAMWKKVFSETYQVMGKGASIYCFMPQGGDQMMMMMMMMMQAGIEPRHELIWLKNNHVLGRSDYCYKHEPIMYAWKEGGHKFYGGFQTSVIECNRPNKSGMHPTMKPVELVMKLVENSSLKDGIVYDAFGGSGTTMVACENLNRKCRMIEISPSYCAVILQRMKDVNPQLVIERLN